MKTLRTPDDRFADLPDFPWQPSYAELTDPDGNVVEFSYGQGL